MKTMFRERAPIARRSRIGVMLALIAFGTLYGSRVEASGPDWDFTWAEFESGAYYRWSKAALRLASQDDGGRTVARLAKGIANGKVGQLKAEFLVQRIKNPTVLKRLIPLLDDPHELVVHVAAVGLTHLPQKEASAALLKALARVKGSFTRWVVAKAAWETDASLTTARAIAEVARKVTTKDDRYLLQQLIDTPVGRPAMLNDERLSYLMEFKIPRRAGWRQCMEWDIERRSANPFLDDEEKKFILTYRTRVFGAMMRELKLTGSPMAAMVLGAFRVPHALLLLREAFINRSWYREWKIDKSDHLADSNYPLQVCYERAIRRIAKRPLERVVKLTDQEVAELLQRYRRRNDYAALYVLYRLKKKAVESEVLKEFRTQPEWREINCFLVRHFLAIGQREKHVLERLGSPDQRRGQTISYNCGRVRLALRFAHGTLRGASIEKLGSKRK